MNVLSIGNSFSQDAQRYLHQIAAADGYDVSGNTFSDFEETVTDQQVATIKSCVATIAAKYGL